MSKMTGNTKRYELLEGGLRCNVNGGKKVENVWIMTD